MSTMSNGKRKGLWDKVCDWVVNMVSDTGNLIILVITASFFMALFHFMRALAPLAH